METSRGNAIFTFTNTRFYPLDPKVDEVLIEDIAHALSQMCRANGHFKAFYSVAQHSINCMKEAKARRLSPRVQLACLIHDASEAYISDITRPVKSHLEEYRKIERKLQAVIFEKFNIADLSEEELNMVEEIDNALLYLEFERLHHQGITKHLAAKLYSDPDVTERDMRTVETEFLELASHITNNLHVYYGKV